MARIATLEATENLRNAQDAYNKINKLSREGSRNLSQMIAADAPQEIIDEMVGYLTRLADRAADARIARNVAIAKYNAS